MGQGEEANEVTWAIRGLVTAAYIFENLSGFGPNRFAWGLELRAAAHQLVDGHPIDNLAWIKTLLVKPAALCDEETESQCAHEFLDMAECVVAASSKIGQSRVLQ